MRPTTPLALSIKQVSDLTGIGRTKIFTAIRNGTLVARKYGRRTIVAYSDVVRWVDDMPKVRGHDGATHLEASKLPSALPRTSPNDC
jgi:excisionase family DNA binding protein